MLSRRRLICAVTPVVISIGWVASSGAWQTDLKAAYRRPAAVDAPVPSPSNDPLWSLGQRIFFDPSLSGSGATSCATCHQPDQAWTDHRPKAIGDGHQPLAFRAPTLLNAGYIPRYGWIGRFPDVEAVSFFAMSSPINMNVPIATLLGRMRANPTYPATFRRAFKDGEITKHHVGAALARYVRSITSDVAPFDRWVAGDTNAISAGAARGFAVFNGKGRCAECHNGWAFTDGSFHDVGIARGSEIGRGALFKTSIKLQYAFKTPTLRNVAARAPYMHDGSLATLEAVVDHYDKGGIDRPSRAVGVIPLDLTRGEKADLVAFLGSLSGGTKFVPISDE